ncbi:hypothetical protein IWW55_007278, partial [Coemansia sp. RSA 2706]
GVRGAVGDDEWSSTKAGRAAGFKYADRVRRRIAWAGGSRQPNPQHITLSVTKPFRNRSQ